MNSLNFSMSPSVRYTTQSSAYDRLLVGKPLTDRIIAKRKAQGYFGGIKTAERKEMQQRKQKRNKANRRALRNIMLDFI